MAATTIERLEVLIEANTKQYARAMEKLQSDNNRALRAIAASADSADKSLQRTSGSASTLTRILMAGLGIRGLRGVFAQFRDIVHEAGQGMNDFGGIIVGEAVPRLAMLDQAFQSVADKIKGTVAAAAAGWVYIGELAGLVKAPDDKFGRVTMPGPTGEESQKELAAALAEKAAAARKAIEGGVTASTLFADRFSAAGPANPQAGLEARAEAAREAMQIAEGQASAYREVKAALDDELASLGRTAVEQEIVNQLKRAGVTAASAQGQAIAAEVRQIYAQREALAAATERMQEFQSAAESALTTLYEDIREGKSPWEILKDQAVQALDAIIRKLIEFQAQQLAAGLFGGGGAGGFLGFLGNLFPHFATGGQLTAGRVGIAGESGPELVTGPATVTPLRGLGAGGPPQRVVVELVETPLFRSVIRQEATGVAVKVTRAGIDANQKAQARARELAA